jgi:hypothetical protein
VTVDQRDSLRDMARELVAAEADAAFVVSPLGETGIVTARGDITVVAGAWAIRFAADAVRTVRGRALEGVERFVVDATSPPPTRTRPLLQISGVTLESASCSPSR